MMSRDCSQEDLRRWRRYLDAFRNLSEASSDILSPDVDRANLVRSTLGRGGTDLHATLWILPYLKPDELKSLFDVLVDWCATGHGVSHHFRSAIKSLPRDWVLDRIEQAAEPVLAAGTDEEYRQLLALSRELDPRLAERLARRAAGHEDPHISEAGRDALEDLAAEAESGGSGPRLADDPGRSAAPLGPDARV